MISKLAAYTLLIWLFCTSCTGCLDCDVVLGEPTIPITFIDQGSLLETEDLILEKASALELLDREVSALTETISAVNDSLSLLEDSIANGGDLETQKIMLEEQLAILEAELSVLSEAATTEDSLLSQLQTEQTVLAIGLTRIDSLFDLETGNYITYQDSASTFNLPLSAVFPETYYRIVLPEQSFELQLLYSLEAFEDEKSRISYRARNVEEVSSSFDSVDVICNNCISENGKVVAYY